MKDLSLIEWAIIAAIVLILAAVFFGHGKRHDEFKRVCDEAGGTTIFDGKQYQCLKR